ncbi:HNH endonuclease signature motif containing protein [Microbacterium sp. K5D]|uniref:HNH endonuclease signature motif containing protein n=1 Tax=Microbacterium sp. K5D TaxID=2305436 RepID=UPI00197BFD72
MADYEGVDVANATQSKPCPDCGDTESCRACAGGALCRPCFNARRRAKRAETSAPTFCAECGEEFKRTHNRQRFCGQECYRRKEWKRLGLMVDPLVRECELDGCIARFTQARKFQKFCSDRCAFAASYARRSKDQRWIEETRRKRAEWRVQNRWYSTVANTRRRALLSEVFSLPITANDLASRMIGAGGKCWMCGGIPTSWDHVKPLSKGGSHILSNLRPACTHCNSSKGAKWDGVPTR